MNHSLVNLWKCFQKKTTLPDLKGSEKRFQDPRLIWWCSFLALGPSFHPSFCVTLLKNKETDKLTATKTYPPRRKAPKQLCRFSPRPVSVHLYVPHTSGRVTRHFHIHPLFPPLENICSLINCGEAFFPFPLFVSLNVQIVKMNCPTLAWVP